MKKALFSLIALLFTAHVAGAESPETLDDLLKSVREESQLEKKENAEREEQFRQSLNQQKRLLDEARLELDEERKRGDSLKEVFEQNEREINAQEGILVNKMGALGELHGIVRQIANDMDAIIDTSLVSAQIKGRDDVIDKLADSKTLPDINELESLWHVALEEMVEAGKVVRFPAKILTNTGNEIQQDAIRIGVFNVVSKGHFLRYLPESDHLIEPGRQPANRYQTMAVNLENSQTGFVPFPIDPTRGALLALLIQVPDFKSRIQQGGIIGYMIIVIGFIGLLIVMVRFIKLNRIDRHVISQLQDEHPKDNPLGRIMQVFQSNPDVDPETLGLKLDEAILKEIPELQKGLRVISLLAEIALLMGLLGTVTGIIETFQSITLFGTGDPRVMSGGISQALVTTVMGLVTSIPLLLLHSGLLSKSNRLIQILDEKSAAFVAMLAEAHINKK